MTRIEIMVRAFVEAIGRPREEISQDMEKIKNHLPIGGWNHVLEPQHAE